VPYQLQLDRQVQRLYLEDLLPLTELSPNLAILRLLILPEEEVGVAARSILDNLPTQEEFQRRLDLVEAILVNKFPQLSFEEVLQMLDLREVNLSETRFYQDVLQKGREQERKQARSRFVSTTTSAALWVGLDRLSRSSQIANHHPVRSSRCCTTGL
jgi:predicted transposase YdaD